MRPNLSPSREAPPRDADAGTPQPREEDAAVHSRGEPPAEPLAEPAAGGGAAASDGAAPAPNAPRVLKVADLLPETEFFKHGLGQDSSMIIRGGGAGTDRLNDRAYLRKVFFLGDDKDTVHGLSDSVRFASADPPTRAPAAPAAAIGAGGARKGRGRVCVPKHEVRDLLQALAEQCPRICTFAGDTVFFRDFPAEEPEQIKLHNELMLCARLSLQEVSQARVLFLKKRPARQEPSSAPPRSRQRAPEGPRSGA